MRFAQNDHQHPTLTWKFEWNEYFARAVLGSAKHYIRVPRDSAFGSEVSLKLSMMRRVSVRSAENNQGQN